MINAVVGALIGSVLGNFPYSAMMDRKWSRAVEWSIAQGSLAAAILLTNSVQ